MQRLVIIILLLLTTLSGCVYYNTFFNAEKYFDDAQKIELKDDGRPEASAIQKYNKAIKKCGIVLTDYKDTKYADDALFMLARSLFYIGRNYTQSIDKFEDIIKFYPESEYVADAKLYIARANYKFRRKELAYELLEEFLQFNEFKDHHAKALQQLADYHLLDKDYVEVDFYLNQIIEKYPKSEEYDNAFFLKGKARHEAKNYEQSNEVFLALQKSSVPRNLKFDAKYYIALNYIMMGDFEQAHKISNKLLKDEYRENSISKIQLIKARGLAKTEKSEEAIQLFNSVMQDNKRSKLSAEASFFLAEHYFEDLQNYDEAIKNYNKVQSEYSKSEFVESALSRSAVASQIIQYNSPSSDLDAEELVLQQFKLAEFYVEALSKPDSALLVYDHIINQKDTFELKLDTLRIDLVKAQSRIDSISQRQQIQNIALSMKFGEKSIADSLIRNFLQPSYNDTNAVISDIEIISEATYNGSSNSLDNNIEEGTELTFAPQDSILTTKTVLADSLITSELIFADSLLSTGYVAVDSMLTANLTPLDSIAIENSIAADSTVTESIMASQTHTPEVIPVIAVSNEKYSDFLNNPVFKEIMALDSLDFSESISSLQLEKDQLESEVNSSIQQVERTEVAIQKYGDDFIPFAKFIKLWIYKSVFKDSLKSIELANDLRTNHAESKYTYATNLFMSGKPIKVTTPKAIEELAEYEEAITLLSNDIPTALNGLEKIASDPDHEYFLKANYSLGHVNFLMLADSSAAKPFFDTVLASAEDNEFKTKVSNIYTGEKYKSITRLPYLDQMEKAAKAKEEEALKQQAQEEESKEKGNDDKSKNKNKSDKEKEKSKSENELEKTKTAEDLKPLHKEELEHIPLPGKTEPPLPEKIEEEISEEPVIEDKTEKVKKPEEEEDTSEEPSVETEAGKTADKTNEKENGKKDPEAKLETKVEPADSTSTGEKIDSKKESKQNEDGEEDTSGEKQQNSDSN